MTSPIGNEPMAPGAPVPKPEKAGLFEDFVDIFYAPSSVYERRRDAGPWLPMLVVALVIGIGWMASKGPMQPMLDAEFARGMQAAMEANPQLTPETMQQMRGFGEAMATISAFIGAPLAIVFTGLLLWLSGKLFDARQSAGTSIMIAAYAFVPRILQAVLLPIQLRFMNPESLDGMYRVSAGPARFLDPDTSAPLLVAVAGRLDLFVIWTTVLLAIGLSVVARIPRAQAWVAAVLVWVAGALPGLWGAINAS